MSIRTKTIWATVIALLCLMVVLNVSIWLTLKSSFGKMEQRDARKSAERAVDAVSACMQAMETKTNDWAAWDDTLKFIEDKNQAYIDSNLGASAIAGTGNNMMLFYNNRGELVKGICVDLNTKEEAPVPKDLLVKIIPGSALLTNKAPDDVAHFIVMTSNGPLMLVKRPITNSQGTEPIGGTFLIGRYLDGDEVKALSKQYSLSLGICLANAESKSGDYAKAEDMLLHGEQQAVIPLSSDRIAGYSLLRDLDGKPAVILRVDSPRDINAQATATVKLTSIGLFLGGLIFGLLNIWWLDKTVLRRVNVLDKYVKDAMDDLGLRKKSGKAA